MKPTPKQPRAKARPPQLDGCPDHVADAVYQSELKRRGYLKTPTRAKARVRYATSADLERLSTLVAQPKKYGPSLDVTLLVVPCSSLSEARRLKRWFGMTEEEKVRQLGKFMFHSTAFPSMESEDCWNAARAVLSAIQGGKK